MDIELAAKQLEALGNLTRLRVDRTVVRAECAGHPVNQVPLMERSQILETIGEISSVA